MSFPRDIRKTHLWTSYAVLDGPGRYCRFHLVQTEIIVRILILLVDIVNSYLMLLPEKMVFPEYQRAKRLICGCGACINGVYCS